MADISAAAVMKLRKMSGQGMMDCKKALAETGGDVDKAMELLRKKGLATLAKRADREASEGIVISDVSEDRKEGILAALCCETDFVAKSDDFIDATETMRKYIDACTAIEGAEALMETEIDDVKFSKVLTDLVSKTGEKTEVGDFVKYKIEVAGFVSAYVHFNKKVGTMLMIETSSDDVSNNEDFQNVINDIAMHVTAVNPLALDKEGIDPTVIEQEKAVYAEQVKNKPAEIVDKIVEGKLQKFYSERCLLSQPFVKDDKKTVEQVLKEGAKAAGGDAKIVKFVRISVGE